jgi:cyclopropane fatty-acyl-phospholipid synthase-like methyltransferase
MNDATINYYDKHAKELIKKYDQAKLKQLHNVFKKYIKMSDTILDIGFGSGRDLKFIQTITPNTFGLDSCDFFVKNMEDNGLKGRVSRSTLPEINIDDFEISINKFDIIISIAVFMHLTVDEIEQTIKNIKNILKKKGVVIISYSLKRQIVDERYFEDLTKTIITNVFNKNGFKEVECFQSCDSMQRKIEWITQVLKFE